jgi:hypothetical protein
MLAMLELAEKLCLNDEAFERIGSKQCQESVFTLRESFFGFLGYFPEKISNFFHVIGT